MRNVILRKLLCNSREYARRLRLGGRIFFREWQSYRNKYTGNGSAVIHRKGRRK